MDELKRVPQLDGWVLTDKQWNFIASVKDDDLADINLQQCGTAVDENARASMRDGLYSVSFAANPQHLGNSIVSIKAGSINGGNFGYYFQGKIADGNISLFVKKFNEKGGALVGESDGFYLNLRPVKKHEDQYELNGLQEGQTQRTIMAMAIRLADLV